MILFDMIFVTQPCSRVMITESYMVKALAVTMVLMPSVNAGDTLDISVPTS